MKKCLLIMPQFFGYENEIRKEINNLGYQTDSVYENIDEISLIKRIQLRYSKNKDKILYRYYTKQIGSNYSMVFVIRGSTLNEKIINKIKENSPNASWYMYQWDSVKNNPNALKIADFFSKVSTFDINDAKIYGWHYRPLFYIMETERNCNRKYDFVYISSVHSQRLELFKKLEKIAENPFFYLYSKRAHYFKQKYIKRNKEFKGVSDKEIKYKPISIYESNSYMAQSDIVIDFTHPNQSGYTMRICEAIGNRCKIVTNNKLIKKADFYNENNVYIYDINNFSIPQKFLTGKYEELSRNVYEKYSIDKWLKEVVDEK